MFYIAHWTIALGIHVETTCHVSEAINLRYTDGVFN
jgi:hypothetical protein